MAFNSQYLPILEHDIADDEEPLEDIHVASVVIPDIEEQDEREYYMHTYVKVLMKPMKPFLQSLPDFTIFRYFA